MSYNVSLPTSCRKIYQESSCRADADRLYEEGHFGISAPTDIDTDADSEIDTDTDFDAADVDSDTDSDVADADPAADADLLAPTDPLTLGDKRERSQEELTSFPQTRQKVTSSKVISS